MIVSQKEPLKTSSVISASIAVLVTLAVQLQTGSMTLGAAAGFNDHGSGPGGLLA